MAYYNVVAESGSSDCRVGQGLNDPGSHESVESDECGQTKDSSNLTNLVQSGQVRASVASKVHEPAASESTAQGPAASFSGSANV